MNPPPWWLKFVLNDVGEIADHLDPPLLSNPSTGEVTVKGEDLQVRYLGRIGCWVVDFSPVLIHDGTGEDLRPPYPLLIRGGGKGLGIHVAGWDGTVAVPSPFLSLMRRMVLASSCVHPPSFSFPAPPDWYVGEGVDVGEDEEEIRSVITEPHQLDGVDELGDTPTSSSSGSGWSWFKF